MTDTENKNIAAGVEADYKAGKPDLGFFNGKKQTPPEVLIQREIDQQRQIQKDALNRGVRLSPINEADLKDRLTRQQENQENK